jgi:hypothetical protein
MNQSNELFKTLNSTVKSYPNEIVPVPEKRLTGTAFFPAGDGIYKEGNWQLKVHYPIMVVGQDYDNCFNFKKVRKSDSQSEVTNSNKTWQNLKKILGEKTLSKCFFTNAIMGLRINDSKNTGVSKALNKGNEIFLKENQKFFKVQLNIIQPELIICLGAQIPRFIGGCLPEQLSELAKVRSFNDLDSMNKIGIFKLKYEGGEGTIIFITHPALYYANVGRRKGGNGREFEEKLIKTTISQNPQI